MNYVYEYSLSTQWNWRLRLRLPMDGFRMPTFVMEWPPGKTFHFLCRHHNVQNVRWCNALLSATERGARRRDSPDRRQSHKIMQFTSFCNLWHLFGRQVTSFKINFRGIFLNNVSKSKFQPALLLIICLPFLRIINSYFMYSSAMACRVKPERRK